MKIHVTDFKSCPHCESKDVNLVDTRINGKIFIEEMYCHDCHSVWLNEFSNAKYVGTVS